ncbi:MAG TPA: TetR/AcrR family transcriptional regulator [Steroidobacteraceae bacterium]|nr:TetR/AcrR family transcriptional regulator [Steroidobacteraceae bacterium]
MSAQAPLEPETRERILRTAFQLFHEQGFHATGIATIVREAGINPGSLYHFFDSKDQLLLQVLEFAIGYLEPAVMAPVERRTSDPFERIFALLAQYREGMVASGCRMGCPIGNLALEVSDSNPEARDLIHRNFQNWASRVAGWLTEAGQRLPKQLDRAQLARFVLTVMEGGLMQARAANDLRPFDEAVAVLRQHLELLRRRTARRRSRAVRRPAGKRRR